MVVEGEQVQASMTTASANASLVEAHKADGTPVLVGTASVGPDHPESELAARRGRQGDPGELFIIDQLRGRDAPLRRRGLVDHVRRLERPAVPVLAGPEGRQDHRAAPVVHARRRGVVAVGAADRAVRDAQRADQQVRPGFPVRGPALGLFLDLEVRMLDGPVFVDEPYEIHREVVGLSQSRRTESYWTESTITEQRSGKAVAIVLLHQGVFKESYAGYPHASASLRSDAGHGRGESSPAGLEFPEGPVWVDGTLYFTEIVGGAVSRWTADGGVERIADDRRRAERRGPQRRRRAVRHAERRDDAGRAGSRPASNGSRSTARSRWSPPRWAA